MANETLNVNVNMTNNRTGYLADAKNIKGGFVVVASTDEIPDACKVAGQLIYNTTDSKFYQYNGTAWVEVDFGGSGGIEDYEVITRDTSLPTATATSPDLVETSYGFYRKVVSNNAYSYKFILPATAGHNSEVLTTTVDGSSVIWAKPTPITTAGDLVVGGIGGVATRMAKGTNGQVLGVDNGTLAWISLPEPMMFRGGAEITIDNQNKYEILVDDATIKAGYTYKITTIGTGVTDFKEGDTLIASKDNPTIEAIYSTLMADWTRIPSGDEPSGTVTSVGLTVPTGLSVSGNPITSSGTLAISLASGYVIPTEATINGKQDTLSATNKLSADYVDDTSTTNKFVTSSDITAWNAKQNAIDSSHKLSADLVDDTSTTNKFVTASDKTAWNGKATVTFRDWS